MLEEELNGQIDTNKIQDGEEQSQGKEKPNRYESIDGNTYPTLEDAAAADDEFNNLMNKEKSGRTL